MLKRGLQAVGLAATIAAGPVASFAQPAHLLRDINPGTDDIAIDSLPGNLTPFAGKLAFGAGSGTWVMDPAIGHATEVAWNARIRAVAGHTLFLTGQIDGSPPPLWVYDGTSGGTRVFPALSSGARARVAGENSIAVLGGRALLLVAKADASRHLWRTDGSASGTSDLGVVGVDDAAYSGFLTVGARVFFTVTQGTPAKTVLWVSDGTLAGTRVVATVPSGSRLGAATSTRLFFSAEVADRQELWVSDGTAGGTKRLISFAAGVGGGQGILITASGAHAYVLADDGAHGVQLWRSDGTPRGTVRLTEFVYPGALYSSSHGPSRIEEVGGKVAFLVRDDQDAIQLWASSGSLATTQQLVSVCANDCFVFDQPPLARLGNRLYFLSGASSAMELWSTDGTPAGTVQVTAFCPASCADIPDFRVAGSKLYFVATIDYLTQLWSSDGTGSGTRRVTGFRSDEAFGFPPSTPEVAEAAGRIWFPANEPPWGIELWSSRGTPQTTELVDDIERGGVGSEMTPPQTFGSGVIFSACDGQTRELWTSDGSSAGTVPLTHLGTDCSDFDSHEPAPDVIGSRAFFWIRDQYSTAATLWATDGTPGGLTQAWNLPDYWTADGPYAVGGQAGLLVRDDQYSLSFWRSDGTAGGAVKVRDIPETICPADSSLPTSVWSDGGSLFFIARSASPAGLQVYRLGLDGTLLQLTSFADTRLQNGTEYVQLGGEIYFGATPPGPGPLQFWKTDGTAAGTALAFTFPVPAGGGVFAMHASGGAFWIYLASFQEPWYELWRVDPATGAATKLARFSTRGISDLPPVSLASLAGVTFFVGDDLDHGRELWVSDGTAAGTRLFRDLDEGPRSSFPNELTAAGGRVFFSARDIRHGLELWQTDGTAAGTRLVQDIGPDAEPSGLQQLVATSSALYFVADDGLTGQEPWALPLNGPTSCTPSDSVLCLEGNRFAVEAAWRDPAGSVGVGHAAPLTSDTGTFWFFLPSSTELIVKLVDGEQLNDHQWVFYGALSNVEYTVTITDTQTGATRRYFNPPGQLASVGDTEAFGPRGSSAAVRAARVVPPASPPPIVTLRHERAATSACAPSATRLCAGGGRFAVEVAWQDFAGHTGVGTATALSADTGDFWFFAPQNIELVVKVLDGRSVNGRFWVFYGALSNVDYTVTVTDTQTGAVRTYHNPSGRLASVADTAAF